jgi:hypothetical protein
MHREPSVTAWIITCRSSEDARALEQWLLSRIDLKRTVVDTVRTAPNEVGHVQRVPHRLADYFSGILVLPDRGADSPRLRLTFERRADAGRYWKDLMVNILQEIEASPQGPSIALDSKGERNEVLAGD